MHNSDRSHGDYITWLIRVLTLLMILSFVSACKRQPAAGTADNQDLSKQDEKDLQTLKEAFQVESAESKKTEEQLAKSQADMQRLKLPNAELQSQWEGYRETLNRCSDLLLQIEKAGKEDRFADVSSLALQGIAASNQMIADLVGKSEQSIEELKKHSGAPKMSVLESETRKLSLYNPLLKVAGQFRNEAFFRALNLIVTSGPRQMRLTTFESISQQYSQEKPANVPLVLKPLESVMQIAFEKEKDPANKAKMEEVLKRLGVALAAPKPSPSVSPSK